jgi:hypothetical protein
MKLDLVILTSALASLPLSSAWRVRFYSLEENRGDQFTRAGPGGSGWKCHTNVGDLHNRVSSMQWWSDNPSHTTRCCIYLYTGKNCVGSLDRTFGHFCRNQYLNFHDWDVENRVNSYKTNCYKIDPDYARRSIDAGEGDELDDDFDPALYPELYQLADEFGEDFDPEVDEVFDEGVDTEAEPETAPL